jgi:hypothetical protein
MRIRIKYLPIYREFRVDDSGKFGLPAPIKSELDSLMIDLTTITPAGTFSMFDFALLVLLPLSMVVGLVTLVMYIMLREALENCRQPESGCPDIRLLSQAFGYLRTVTWVLGGGVVGSILATARSNHRYWLEIGAAFEQSRANLNSLNSLGILKVHTRISRGPVCFPCCFAVAIRWKTGSSLDKINDGNETLKILPEHSFEDRSFDVSVREEDQTQSHTSEVNLTPHGTELETEPTDLSLTEEGRRDPP